LLSEQTGESLVVVAGQLAGTAGSDFFLKDLVRSREAQYREWR
jgi:hypothetical protein